MEYLILGFEAWLAQWKPGDLSITALVLIFVAFFMLKFWPWLTTVYWPAQQKFREKQYEDQQKREEENTKATQEFAEVLIELRVLISQNIQISNAILERLSADSKSIRSRKVSDATQPKKPRAKKELAA